MAQRQRNFGSDVGSGFRQGMSVVADLTQLYVQTSSVMQDRAMRQKAEQVSLEVAKQMEAAEAPLVAAQAHASAVAEEHAKKGTDVPDDLTKQLRAGMEQAQGDYALAMLEISMNTTGANLGNKYVNDDMMKMGDQALGLMGKLSQEAMLTQQIADREAGRMHEVEAQQRGFGQSVALEGIQQQGSMELAGERSRLRKEEIQLSGQEQRKTDAAQGGKIDLVDLKRATEAADAELQGLTGEQWMNMLEQEGIEGTQENLEDFQRAKRHESIGQKLLSKYSPETVDLLVSPATLVSSKRPDAFTEKSRLWKQQVADLRKQGDPRSMATADRLEKYAADQAKVSDKLRREGKIDEAKAELSSTFDGMLGNLIESLAATGQESREAGFGSSFAGGVGQIPTSAGAKQTAQAQGDVTAVPDVGQSESPGFGSEPPVGTELEDDIEMDLIQGLGELLPENERTPQLTLKRVK